MNEFFWSTVRVLIKKAGITQTDLAKSVNISVRTFQDWIYSKKLPDVENCYRIAKALNVPIEFLLTGETNNKTEIPSLREDEALLLSIYNQIPEPYRGVAEVQLKALIPLKDLYK